MVSTRYTRTVISGGHIGIMLGKLVLVINFIRNAVLLNLCIYQAIKIV